MQFIIGTLLAIIIAYLAFRARSLNQSGAYAAFLVGTIIFGLGGWEWAVLLLTFFITSSALSRMFKESKREGRTHLLDLLMSEKELPGTLFDKMEPERNPRRRRWQVEKQDEEVAESTGNKIKRAA